MSRDRGIDEFTQTISPAEEPRTRPVIRRASARTRATWVALLAVIASSAYGEAQYCRLSTDRITVVAHGSAKRCGKLAGQFLTFERLLRELAALDEDVTLPPLAVYSLADIDARRVFFTESDQAQEKATRLRLFSKYLPGPELNVAAIVDADGSDEPLQSVLLLYARGIFTSGPTRGFPLWYVTGLAEVTNGLMIRDDGSVLLSREGPFGPIVDKSVRTKYDLAALLATTGRELSDGGDWKAFSRRAREWAQFGLLTTAERRNRYRELAMLMRQGTPTDEAVNQAFGSSLAEVSKEFEDGRWHHEAQFKIPAPKTTPPVPAAELMDAGQTRTLLQVVADRVAQQPLHP